MPTRRAIHRPPAFTRAKRERTLTVPTSGGFHGGVPPQELPLGFTPASRNVVPDRAGSITPRSGLSQGGPHDFGGAVIGASEVFDINGRSVAFAPSNVSLSVFHPKDDDWSYLSYVPGTVASAMTDGPVSGTSSDYFRSVSIYDQNINERIGVFSNGTNAIKFFSVVSGTNKTYSDFTFVDSLDSTKKARDVTAVNDRLVFANVERADGEVFPTRVLWSARGDPRNYDINSEAGFEDIMEMRGEIQAAVRFKDYLILFTEHEIWRATPTFDAYAFRFDRVVDNMGCPWPKTAVATPVGVIFLGNDLDVHITDGSGVLPIGPVQVGDVSRIRQTLQEEATTLGRAWSVYNRSQNRYELYYATGVTSRTFVAQDASGYPTRAFFYHLGSRTWWPQRFTHELSSGVDVDDADVSLTWDDIDDGWGDLDANWDDFTYEVKTRSLRAFSSDGTGFSFLSTQTTDDGTAIDARWRSPSFRLGGSRKMHLSEVWVDYEADSASSLSVSVGNGRDDSSFETGTRIALTSPGKTEFVPTWTVETAPAFEIRLSDGGTPRILSFQATLKDGSRF